ncbi:MAG: helix-turn-helix transcriptional regulator [Deltaproteobacteria bacterium]|nr:helix-turn-helix transcriptional regulator [Deltaproteobacteria bacterium]
MNNKKPSWLQNKLSDPKFKKGYEKEVERLGIAEQILQLRMQAKLTQSQLAKKIGTTASAISRYENAAYGQYGIQTLYKIAAACGCRLRISFEQVLMGRRRTAS